VSSRHGHGFRAGAANEALETSKEELQSMNEETVTVNSELNTKI
jgi:two-component system CheB/CheR fusion protein